MCVMKEAEVVFDVPDVVVTALLRLQAQFFFTRFMAAQNSFIDLPRPRMLKFYGSSFLVAFSKHPRDILVDTPDTRDFLVASSQHPRLTRPTRQISS